MKPKLLKNRLTYIFACLIQSSLHATTWHVTNNNDSGAGSLRSALVSANSDLSTPTIVFDGAYSPIVLASALPILMQSMTINGVSGSQQIINGGASYPGFIVKDGVSANVSSIGFLNTTAQGGAGGTGSGGGGGGPGAGGGVFIAPNSTVNLTETSFQTCRAIGGAGGVGGTTLSGGGGGGGLNRQTTVSANGGAGQAAVGAQGGGGGGGGGLGYIGGAGSGGGGGGGGSDANPGLIGTGAAGGNGGNAFSGSLGGTGGSSNTNGGSTVTNAGGGGGGLGTITPGNGGSSLLGGGGGGGANGAGIVGGNGGSSTGTLIGGGGGGGGGSPTGAAGGGGIGGIYGAGGGGGRGTSGGNGANGGFGGGGGGAGSVGAAAGTSAFLGGSGGTTSGHGGGGGGAALGGALFLGSGATATITSNIVTPFLTGMVVTGGAAGGNGATAGTASGTNVFMTSGSTLAINNSNAITLSSIASNQSAITTGGLIIQGSNTVTLSGTNTYTGTTRIQSGRLLPASNTSLGSVSPILHPIQFTGTGTLALPTGFNTGRGIDFASGSSATISPVTTTTLSGQLTGPGSVTFSGGSSSITILTNNSNNNSGNFTIGNGFISISNPLQLGSISQILANPNTRTAGLRTTASMTINLPLNITGSGEMDFEVVGAANTLLYTGAIANTTGNGSIGINDGGGILEFTADNSGLTASPSIIFNGTSTVPYLRIHADNNLGSPSSVIRVVTSGTIEFANSIVCPPTRSFSTTASGVFQLICDAGTESQIQGQIIGTAPTKQTKMRVTGPGSMFFTNPNNTYQAGTNIISGATLGVQYNGSLGLDVSTNPVTINNSSLRILQAGGGINSVNRPLILGGSNGALLLDDNTASKWSSLIQGSQSLTIQASPGMLGTGSLELAGNNSSTFSGHLTVNNATLQISNDSNLSSNPQLTLNQATLELLNPLTLPASREINLINTSTILAEGNSSIDGPITGGGNLTKDGSGSLTLNGTSTYTGNTLITEGSVYVEGDISSSALITAAHGTFLGGTGRIGNASISGTLSPGNNSIGTLSGNQFNLLSGSTYMIQVMGFSTDQIASTNTINILPGSTLEILPTNIQQQFYTIATATGGISGTFSFVSKFPRYSFQVFYEPNEIVLQIGLNDFIDFFGPGNLRNIAACFDNMINNNLSDGLTSRMFQLTDSPDINRILQVLNSLSESGVREAFNQFDPSLLGSINIAELDTSEGLLEFYTNHISHFKLSSMACCAHSNGLGLGILKKWVDESDCSTNDTTCSSCDNATYSLWIAPYGMQNNRRQTGELRAYSGYNNRTYGIASGCDFQCLKDLFTTVGFSYSNSKMGWKTSPNTHAMYNSYSGIFGLSFVNACLSIEACFAGSYHLARAERSVFVEASPLSPIFIDPLDYKIRNHNKAYSLASSLSTACNLYTSSVYDELFFSIWPYLNVDYLYVHQYGYSEKGGDSLNMHMHARETDLFIPEGGLGFSLVKNDCDMLFYVDASLGYTRECRFQGHRMQANFRDDSGCEIDLTGLFPRIGLFIPRVDIGIEIPCNGIACFFSYKHSFSHSYQSRQMTFELNKKF